MVTSALREAIRAPLPALGAGYHFWRLNGARIQRAKTLCEYADGLRFRRRRAWRNRSERLYGRVIVELAELAALRGLTLPPTAALQDRAVEAHGALSLARRPYRVLSFALALLSCAFWALVVVAVLLVAAVSPHFRQRVFPHDLAEGRPWQASSGFSGMPAAGVGQASTGASFFHTNDSEHPWLEIDLGGDHLVRSLRIVNRSDCCAERAIPLNVEAWVGGEWRLIAQRRAPFSVWKYDVDPIVTSRIRVGLPGRGFFHLKHVSIYGA